MNEEIELPNQLSELLEIALKDLISCERSSRYRIDMCQWHYPASDGKCDVCLAGSVMAKSLKIPHKGYASPIHFVNGFKFKALDSARKGNIDEALRKLDAPFFKRVFFPSSVNITPYGTNKTRFKKDIKKLIKDLKEIGL